MKELVKTSKNKNGFRKFWEKFWWAVWKDDSFKGWIISLLFLFILIKFIIFPLLNLVTGTSLPLAIVESCSMYHKGDIFGNFDNWYSRHVQKYNQYDINQSQFNNFIFKKGLNKGDILFIVKANPDKIKVGQIIIFNGGQANPIIHRVINITINPTTGERTFSTLGDNNWGQLSVENGITGEQLVGRPVFKIAPSLGWVKLIFYEGRKPAYERGLCHEN